MVPHFTRTPSMPQDANRLIWIDMEMTGLAPDTDRILELALIVTDHELNAVAVAPVWVVHQDAATLAAMDAWNQSTHGKSGLIDKVRASNLSEAEVETAALAFLREHIPARSSLISCARAARRRRQLGGTRRHADRRGPWRSTCGAQRCRCPSPMGRQRARTTACCRTPSIPPRATARGRFRSNRRSLP